MRLALPALLLFLSAIPCAASLSAQERTRDETQDRSRREAPDRSRVTPSVGLTRVPLGYQWGGGLKAASAAIGMSMRAIRESGIRISARALVPVEGRAAIPDCVPEAGGCKEYRTPNALFDFSAGAYTGSKDGKLRVSAAMGWLHASGLRGAATQSSSTVETGAEIAPLGERGFAPVIGLHLVYVTRGVAGARTLLIPSIGLAF